MSYLLRPLTIKLPWTVPRAGLGLVRGGGPLSVLGELFIAAAYGQSRGTIYTVWQSRVSEIK